MIKYLPRVYQISNICKSLSKEVERFHHRPLRDEYIYLILDGIVVKIKTPLGVKKKVFLCAYGIKGDGGQVPNFL